MSYREVTDLRKSGQLDEAIQMAERDLESKCDDWTLSALFWCLNDLYKRQQGEDREQTVARMGELVQRMEEENDVAEKCLEHALASISPYFETIRNATEQSKQGDAYKSYEELSRIYEEGALPVYNYEDYGWVIYRTLRQNPKLEVLQQKKMLMRYLDLKVERPSLLHSMILTIAVGIERETSSQLVFFSFLGLWDLKNLREEDWEGGRTEDGKPYPSLVEKVINVGMKELLSTPSATPSEDFLEVLKKAVEKWPDNINIIRYHAQICQLQGDREEASRLYKKAITCAPDKYYLWADLAEIVDDTDLGMALLCKALSINVPAEFLGKIRIALASMLIDKGMFGWAADELAKVKELYDQQGWKLPAGYSEVFGGIPAETSAKDARPQYAKYVPKAEAYIFSDLPTVVMVKIREQVDTHPNKNDNRSRTVVMWTLIDEYGSKVRLKPKSLGLPTQMPNGQCFNVKVNGEHIVFIKKLDDIPDVKWIKEVSGEIRIKTNREGKQFGFVGKDYYVHNDLLNDIVDGAVVSGVAIRQNGKWQCVRIC